MKCMAYTNGDERAMAADETFAFDGDMKYSGPRPTYFKETPGFLPVRTSGGWYWNKQYYCVNHIKQEDLKNNDIDIVLGKHGEYRLSEEDFLILRLAGIIISRDNYG